MSNFIFTSHFQKRFENGNLIAVSEKDYSFQNIPIGYGDKTLANTVIDFCIDRVVSFEIHPVNEGYKTCFDGILLYFQERNPYQSAAAR